jgi:hypothetical protein
MANFSPEQVDNKSKVVIDKDGDTARDTVSTDTPWAAVGPHRVGRPPAERRAEDNAVLDISSGNRETA